MADPEGALTPHPHPPIFKYPMKVKVFYHNETKLFNFHGIFQKNEIKISKANPHTFIYMNPLNPGSVREKEDCSGSAGRVLDLGSKGREGNMLCP